MTKKALVIMALLTSWILTTALKGQPTTVTFISENHGFSFDHPANWPREHEELVSTNSGPVYDEITFGNSLIVRYRDGGMNAPANLEELYANNWMAMKVGSDSAYPAFETKLTDGSFQIDLASDYATPRIVSLIFPAGIESDVVDEVISSFKFQ